MTIFILAFGTLAFLLGALAYLAMPAGSKLHRAALSVFFALLLGALFFGYELNRPAKIDANVGLWVQGPGDVQVGYSDKPGMIFNLLRDDLGHSGDPNSMNYEVAYGRGHWAGEYVVNAMLYRSHDHKFPVPAHLRVSLQDGKGQVQEILQSDVKLAFEGQETTAFRFKLDGKGAFEPGSMNRIHKNLRNAGAKQ
jgi:hypothetical protein